MPFVLIIIGLVLLISAVRNTQQDLFFLLAHDLTGPNNFIYWIVTILIIGAIGYIPKLKPISDAFLILVVLVLFLRRGTGVFDMFNKAIGTTATATPKVTNPTGTGFLNTAGIGADLGINIGSGRVGINLPGGIHVGIGGGTMTGSNPDLIFN